MMPKDLSGFRKPEQSDAQLIDIEIQELNDMQQIQQSTLSRILFCVGIGSFILAVTDFFIPNYIPITGILVGVLIVGFIYYFPGHVSAIRDLQLLFAWIITALISILVVKLYCFERIEQVICSPSAVRSAVFGNLTFPGIIVVASWLDMRFRHLIYLLRSRKQGK
jgi:hypothetical protein